MGNRNLGIYKNTGGNDQKVDHAHSLLHALIIVQALAVTRENDNLKIIVKDYDADNVCVLDIDELINS